MSDTYVPPLPPARYVTRNGFSTAYFVTGPDDGPPLLLCHGLAANGLQFVIDADFFANRGFRVIVPDLRGHGRSTCPEHRRDEDFTIGNLAADLTAVLDAEDVQSVNWVGNSLGGILALSMMGTDTHRLNRVVTYGTSYSLNLPNVTVSVMQWGYRLFGPTFVASLAAPSITIFKSARSIIFEMLSTSDSDAVARTAMHLIDYDFIRNAADFKRPILLIRAETDWQVNAALGPTLKTMRRRKNFQLAKLANAGHCANLDQPGRLRAMVLAFLNHAY